MKRIVMSLVACTLAGSVFAECTYNFDATQSQLSQVDSSMLRFPINDKQKVGFNISPTPEMKAYAALSSNYAYNSINANSANPGADAEGDVNVNGSGIYAWEYKIKVPDETLTGEEALLFFPINMGGTLNNSKKMDASITYANNVSYRPNEKLFQYWTNLSGTGYDLPITQNGIQRIGLYVNKATKQIGLIFNGSNKGYIGNYDEDFNKLFFSIGGGEYKIGSSSTALNKEMSVELVTDHSKLQFTYPTGTKDICGNAL